MNAHVNQAFSDVSPASMAGNAPSGPLAHMAALLDLEEDRRRYAQAHKREFPLAWYAWQEEGFAALEPQVMTLAGNRTGKTAAAGFHLACDMTGGYGPDWRGFRFSGPVNALAMGVDNEQLKTVVQRELFGLVDENRRFGGGWVHPDEIVGVEWSAQVPNLARHVHIRHSSGNTSRITLRAYTQSKTGQATLSFAGTSIDVIWVDECPPDELVGQLVTRTMTGNLGKGGRIRYTMTPELGATKLVAQFMESRGIGQKLIGPISWDECAHLTPELQQQILAGIPEHEHDMRRKGVPYFGSGLVYPIAEDRIKVQPFRLDRPWWRVIRAIDLGINHPTALVWLAYDPEDDCIYVVKTYAVKGENAATHAVAANCMWAHAPCVFPHDVDTTEKGSGKTVRQFYTEAGLKNTRDFENPDGSIKVEPGIMAIYERMRDGRFKVFADCLEFWREFRMYHRSDGKLVKEHDDVMDAVRYGAMMITRFGAPLAGKQRTPKVTTGMAVKMRKAFRGR